MKNESSLYMPFIIRDFRGGTSSSAINSDPKKGCFLFNQYELINLSVRTTLDYGSKLFAWGNVHMSKSVQHLSLNMVGSDDSFLFQMTNSTYSKILYYHVPDTTANNSNPLRGKSEISFVGGVNFNSVSINLSSYTVNSSNYYFPFNYYFSFKFVNPPKKDSSIFLIPHKTKIMTGCNFEIGENCNVTIGDMVVYNVFNDDNQNIGGTKYPSLEPARFWNKGTVKATNLAGCVINDGTINISGNKTITSYEAWEQLGMFMRRWATIKMHYSEFTSSFAANNNRVLIFKRNIAKEKDISYSYNSTNLSGYYTDYIASGSTIKISNWTNIKSISINGANYSQNNTYAVSNSTKVEILPTTGWF